VRTVPFTPLQEAVYTIERSLTPWTVQVEAATTATLDLDRLGAAARTAVGTYPIARARCRSAASGLTSHEWVVPDGPVEVPVEVVDGADADAAMVRVAERTDAITSTDRAFGSLEWWRALAAVAPPAIRRRVPAPVRRRRPVAGHGHPLEPRPDPRPPHAP
jgi:hypothetical protein